VAAAGLVSPARVDAASVATLRLRAEDHGLQVRFGLRQTRGYGLWRIAIVHEDRVATRRDENDDAPGRLVRTEAEPPRSPR